MVKNYRDDELLYLASNTDGFTSFPKENWLLIVRSKADKKDKFDDKVYQFKGLEFIDVATCTSNTGSYGLLNYKKWNRKGAFVIKSDLWQYDVWKNGRHRGKMDCLVQNKEIIGYRDGNLNMLSEEVGMLHKGFYGINFHTVSYTKVKNFILKYIGRWSVGCVVVNNVEKYYRILNRFKKQETVTMCMITEK